MSYFSVFRGGEEYCGLWQNKRLAVKVVCEKTRREDLTLHFKSHFYEVSLIVWKKKNLKPPLNTPREPLYFFPFSLPRRLLRA